MRNDYKYYRLHPNGRGAAALAAAFEACRLAREEVDKLVPPQGTPLQIRGKFACVGLPDGVEPTGNAWRKTRDKSDDRVIWEPNPRTKAGKDLRQQIGAIPAIRPSPWVVFDAKFHNFFGIFLGSGGGHSVRIAHPGLYQFGDDWYVAVPVPGAMDHAENARGDGPNAYIPLDADEIKASEWYAAKEAQEAAEKDGTP